MVLYIYIPTVNMHTPHDCDQAYLKLKEIFFIKNYKLVRCRFKLCEFLKQRIKLHLNLLKMLILDGFTFGHLKTVPSKMPICSAK